MKIQALSIVTALSLLVTAGCDGGAVAPQVGSQDSSGTVDTEKDQSKLRDLIMGIDPDPLPEAQSPTETSSIEGEELTDDAVNACIYRQYEGTELYETLVSFDPNSDVLWPGAVVQTEGLAHGLLAPIALPRRPGTITLTNATIDGPGSQSGYSRTLEEPSLGAMQDAIDDILKADTINVAAKNSFVAEQVYSLSQAAVKAGVSVKWMSGSVRSSFEGDWRSRRTTYIVRFVQNYYTVSFEAPEAPEKVFGADVAVDDARPYMSAGNLPGFVSNVSYGRMLFVKIESDASSSEVKAAIDASFSTGAVDVDADAEYENKKVMQESTVTVFALGGDPGSAVQIMTADDRMDKIRAFINDGANYSRTSPGVPISYTVRRLADNQTIKVSSSIDYEIPDCTAAPQVVRLNFDRIQVMENGDNWFGGDSDFSYKIFLQVEGEQQEQLIKQGMHTDIGDGDNIQVDHEEVLLLQRKQGEAFTIRAEVTGLDGTDKTAHPNRSHQFTLNPATLDGGWSQPGAQAPQAGAGGNLEVRLHYTLTVDP